MTNTPVDRPRLKVHLGIPENATSRDARIDQIVDGVNSYITSRTGREFSDGGVTFTERYPGTGARALVLNRYPIVAVTSIDEDGVALDPTDSDVVDIHYEQGIIHRTDGGVWQRSLKPLYTIVYTAEESVPERVALAALEIAGFIYRGGGTQRGRKTGGFSQEMLDSALDKLPAARSAIDSYSDSARGFLQGRR